MRCPRCKATTEVIDSRPTPENTWRRRRACKEKSCGFRMSTYERWDEDEHTTDMLDMSSALRERLEAIRAIAGLPMAYELKPATTEEESRD